jgi:hypothetical protein
MRRKQQKAERHMIEGSCHCGSIRITVARVPSTVTDCNCSICRRYGALWAYYKASDVQLRGTRSSMSSYLWGKQRIRFMRCGNCGCITHWEPAGDSRPPRIGVNARNLDPQLLGNVRVRRLDGAKSWKYLD